MKKKKVSYDFELNHMIVNSAAINIECIIEQVQIVKDLLNISAGSN